MAEQSYKRDIARICSIHTIQSGTYVLEEGWNPNYVLKDDVRYARVNIMAIIVEKHNDYSFTMDDGTGHIRVIDFSQQAHVADLHVGDPVLVIGKPRRQSEEQDVFIAAEIIASKQLQEQPQWLIQRKEWLSQQPDVVEKTTENKEQPQEKKEDDDNTTPVEQTQQSVTGDDIIDFVRKKDTGDGCLLQDVIDYYGEDAEHVVHTLITMGEVYELTPGKIKVLE